MADAKKCDRCGQFYDPYGITISNDRINYRINGFRYTCDVVNINEPKELCPGCLQKLFEFMNERGR